MPDKKLEKLNKLLELMQNDTVSPKDIQRFVLAVVTVIKQSKDELGNATIETQKSLNQAVSYLEEQQKKTVASLTKETVMAKAEMVKKLDSSIAEMKAMCEQMMLDKPEDGVDADEELIVEKVLSRIPEVKPTELDTPEEILAKINSLSTSDDKFKIDVSHIKGLKQGQTTISAPRMLAKLHDVVITDVQDGDTLAWDAAIGKFVNTVGGGGSGVTTVGTIDSQTPSTNGAVISGTSIYMQSASATKPGLVNNTTQAFSGVKLFSAEISDPASLAYGLYSITDYSNSVNNNGTYLGSFIRSRKMDNNNESGALLRGLEANAEITGNGNISTSVGLVGDSSTQPTSSASADAMLGVIGSVTHNGSGTIAALIGVNASVDNNSTATEAAGLYVTINNTGTLGTSYGVRIAALAGTTKYGFYNEVSSSINVFDNVRPLTSAGFLIESANGTDIGLLGAGNTANAVWYGSHNFSAATQDTIAAFVGAGKTLSSLATATYPSLTELSYVKGLTSAVQTQLDGKQASLGFTPEDVANKTTSIPTDGTSNTKYPSAKAVKDYADSLVVGLLDYRGAYDASGNVYPSSGGSGTAGAILKGDMWIISVAGTMGTQSVQVGDSLIANVDTPGTTDANWNVLNSNISYVPENVANKVTSISGASTDTQYASAKLLYDQLALKAPLISPTFATSITGSYLTASTILIADGSKNIISADTATYPSLTELTYLKGVTSSIQTQFGTYLPLVGATYTTTSGNGLALTTSTLTTGNLVSLASTGTAAGSNSQTVLNIATSGANGTSTQTTYGLKVANTHTGTSSTNIAGYFTASGGTNNYGLIVAAGSVGIGTTTPGVGTNVDTKLHIVGSGTSPTGRTEFRVENTAASSAARFTMVNNAGGQISIQASGSTYLAGTYGAVGTSFGLDLYLTTDGDLTSGGSKSIYFKTGGFSVTPMAIFTSTGKVGVGTVSPTALLHLAAGTTAASTAPLKFTSGSLMTAPEAGAVEFLADAYYGTITTGTARKKFAFIDSAMSIPAFINLNAPEGFLINGKIVPSVATNNLTVAIKGMDGNDPSATNPVYCRINGVVRSITAALSVTKNAGTNYFNSGSTELAAKEIDYFVYLGYNATDGVVVGFARIPYASQYSDFNTTNTNEKYCAISTITTAASTDYYHVIGRFAASLSATASFNWSVPTFTAINLINRPIYETRILTWTATYTGFSADPTGSTNQYQIISNRILLTRRYATGGTSNAATFTINAPFSNNSGVQTGGIPVRVRDNGSPTTTPGQMYIANASNSLVLAINMSTVGGGGFTASAGKDAEFIFWYQI